MSALLVFKSFSPACIFPPTQPHSPATLRLAGKPDPTRPVPLPAPAAWEVTLNPQHLGDLAALLITLYARLSEKDQRRTVIWDCDSPSSKLLSSNIELDTEESGEDADEACCTSPSAPTVGSAAPALILAATCCLACSLRLLPPSIWRRSEARAHASTTTAQVTRPQPARHTCWNCCAPTQLLSTAMASVATVLTRSLLSIMAVQSVRITRG